jgi:biotin-dependent carboxylase-like uncharacterized protein
MVDVLKPGLYSTIQDLGRFGVQQYGVPFSGVMDKYSASLTNSVLENDTSCAVLEITMTGPTLQFNCKTVICISGADMSPKLNNEPIQLNSRIEIKENDVLSFGKLQYGFRCYLAVFEGFKTKKVMNSRSMYLNITSQFRLQKGDKLSIKSVHDNALILNNSIKIDETHFSSNKIEVIKGSEFDLLSKEQQKLLFEKTFTISKRNNRMAYVLEESFQNSLEPIITSLVLPGTVQLTPSGKLIVLMRDCQTTGGYPRVLQLKEASINRLSQKYTGNSIVFKLKE